MHDLTNEVDKRVIHCDYFQYLSTTQQSIVHESHC
jgi:hypothetical protein